MSRYRELTSIQLFPFGVHSRVNGYANPAENIVSALEGLPDTAERAYVESILWQGTVSVSAEYQPELVARLADPDGDDYPGLPNGDNEWDGHRTLDFAGDQFEPSDAATDKLAADLQSFWASLPATVRLKLVAFTPRFDATQFAHDYALTRHGHGAGYWDRSEAAYGGLNDYLTEWSQTMGEVNLYLNADTLEVEIDSI